MSFKASKPKYPASRHLWGYERPCKVENGPEFQVTTVVHGSHMISILSRLSFKINEQ